MHRRGNYACSFLCDKYHNWRCVAIVIAPSLVFLQAACRARRCVRDDVKRVLKAPHDAYHAHVRALAAHSKQKKS
jgi:hypothetical protein